VTRAIRVRAFAKINLSLQVVGARSDGYHELRTTFQSLALHDTLTCRARPGPFHIVCDDEACPAGESNLVWRAAEGLWASAGRRGMLRDVAVRISKRIPIAAGLGGGSSDAAAAIRALAALWRVELGAARARRLAAALGADVPFFLDGGTALGVGRGDLLRRLADAPPAWVTLVVPSFGVSTADAYRWFDELVTPVARPFPPSREASADRRSLGGGGQGRDPRGTESPALLAQLQNDLEAPVAARHPEIAHLVEAFRDKGASHAAMSGSGSSVFGLFDRRAGASAAARAVAGRGRRVIVTRTVDRAGYGQLARPMRAR
jgi:4-diphosphocytidyl-2-C-methyl-D-erythritol kinase